MSTSHVLHCSHQFWGCPDILYPDWKRWADIDIDMLTCCQIDKLKLKHADSCDVPFINFSLVFSFFFFFHKLKCFFFSFFFHKLKCFFGKFHMIDPEWMKLAWRKLSTCDDWKPEQGERKFSTTVFLSEPKITKLHMFTFLCFECFKKSFYAPISQTVCRQNASDFFAFKTKFCCPFQA